jgi:hypothetical protein
VGGASTAYVHGVAFPVEVCVGSWTVGKGEMRMEGGSEGRSERRGVRCMVRKLRRAASK